LPQRIIEREIRSHLEHEGREADDPHGEEIRQETEAALRDQLLLDVLAESLGVDVSQDELLQFLFTTAQRYGMDPSEFITTADQNGQIPSFVAELARNKALVVALRQVRVLDTAGNPVDLTAYVGAAEAEEASDDEDETLDVPADDQPE